MLVTLSLEVADPTPQTHTGVAGVDVGVRYLAVTATTRGDRSFHSGKGIVPKAYHYARLRKRLQKKGTRSATRRLVVMSGREKRLKQDANHVVSKHIVAQHPHSLIGLENLTHIRERGRLCWQMRDKGKPLRSMVGARVVGPGGGRHLGDGVQALAVALDPVYAGAGPCGCPGPFYNAR